MPDKARSFRRQRRAYPKLWGFSVTSISYRLGQLGWDSVTAHAALERILECKIELSTVRTGISDGNNPKYEQGKAASLTLEQVAQLNRAAGRDVGHSKVVPQPEMSPSYPEEVSVADLRVEGACRTITVNAYERDPEVRRLCIASHGTTCAVCGMSFSTVYGPVAFGYIHVHHLRPLSEVQVAHGVDPVKDLRPVCPNCHAVLHRRVPAFSIEDVQEFLAQQR